MSGMSQSVITTAGRCSANKARASRPFFANRTLYRSRKRECSTSLRETAESSTTRIVKGWEEASMHPPTSAWVECKLPAGASILYGMVKLPPSFSHSLQSNGTGGASVSERIPGGLASSEMSYEWNHSLAAAAGDPFLTTV